MINYFYYRPFPITYEVHSCIISITRKNYKRRLNDFVRKTLKNIDHSFLNTIVARHFQLSSNTRIPFSKELFCNTKESFLAFVHRLNQDANVLACVGSNTGSTSLQVVYWFKFYNSRCLLSLTIAHKNRAIPTLHKLLFARSA